MLTIYNWNTSPIDLKTSVLPLDNGITNFQFAFTPLCLKFVLRRWREWLVNPFIQVDFRKCVEP